VNVAANAKAIGGGIGGAVSQIILWVLTGPIGWEIPGEVQIAISVLVTAAIVWAAPANVKAAD
jgi:hypothetical protein